MFTAEWRYDRQRDSFRFRFRFRLAWHVTHSQPETNSILLCVLVLLFFWKSLTVYAVSFQERKVCSAVFLFVEWRVRHIQYIIKHKQHTFLSAILVDFAILKKADFLKLLNVYIILTAEHASTYEYYGLILGFFSFLLLAFFTMWYTNFWCTVLYSKPKAKRNNMQHNIIFSTTVRRRRQIVLHATATASKTPHSKH